MTSQGLLFPEFAAQIAPERTSTFVDNMKLPVHRWFRYSAGFSARWVESVIAEWEGDGPIRVFDPFAGAGTTLIAAEQSGVEAIGVESHPFVARVAKAKLHYRSDPERFLQRAGEVHRLAASLRGGQGEYPRLIQKCFTADSLRELDRLRRAWAELQDDSPASELVWLTIVSILRSVSHAGTAPWQYVLPRKTKRKVMQPVAAFELASRMIASDMRLVGRIAGPRAVLHATDARSCECVPDGVSNLVVTSPPYANNFDYADATRLEMCFMREIDGWGDLQQAVRSRLIRSCSQHVPESAVDLYETLSATQLSPIRRDLQVVCERLAEVRLTKGGKKTYHLMVACYFRDLADVWRALRRVCAQPARLCFVVGDSAPYGVHVPVADWLGELALAAGFRKWTFEKTRDRNVKWKNRKHRVPLCEGRLWISG